MSGVMALRKEYQESVPGEVRHQARLHVLLREGRDRRAEARARGQRRNPRHDIVYKNFYDIGVAVGGGKGWSCR
jgi:hypothetical protein